MYMSGEVAVRCIPFVLLFFLIAAPALAQETSRSVTADEAEVEFRLGNQAFMNGDCQLALSHYFASNRLVPNRNVVFNVAACYEFLERPVEAYRYYRSLLYDADDVEERETLEEALARTREQLGLIRIQTDPPGATIFVDRRDLGAYGTTPQTLPLMPGTYRLILDHEAWETREIEEVEIVAGSETEHLYRLTRREGSLHLTGHPTQISVTVEPFGFPDTVELPGQLTVPVGAQTLLVEAAGFEASRYTIDVADGGSTSLEISLLPQTATVVVTSTELNSAVLVDGVVMGFTPVVLPNVPVGTRTISVQQEGFAPETREIELERDDHVELSARLSAITEVAAASRVAESLRDAPASVSLISSREIDAFAHAGTADALLGVRGIFLTNDLTYNLIGVRGYGPFGQFGNRTLVQIDGHTINDSWVEASYHQFEILSDLYGLDRIEVIRGPNSVLYGSGAFQGVINMVSPDLTDPYRPSRVGATAVTDGVVRGYAHHHHSFDNGGLMLSAGLVGAQPSDFFSPARAGTAESPSGIAREMGAFHATTLRGAVQIGDLRLYSHWHDRDLQVPTAAYETLFGDRRSTTNDQRGFVGLRFDDSRTDVPLTFHGRLYYDFYGFNGRYPYDDEDGGLLTDQFRGHWGGVEGRADWRPTDSLRLSLGAELVRHFIHDARSFATEDGEILDSSNPFWKTSAHVALRQELGTRASLWAGARYDLWHFDSRPGGDGTEGSRQIANVNPRAALLFRPIESGTLKLMGGRGFRAPSVYEMTYNDGGFTQIASPDLDPETIYSGEIEYIQTLFQDVEILGAIYANRIGTRIEQIGEGDEDDPFEFVNLDTALWSTGAEVELRRPFLQGWMLSLQYSFQRTEEGELADVFGNARTISNSPNHLAAVQLITPIHRPAIQLANRLIFEAPRIDRVGSDTNPVLLWDVIFSGRIPDLPFRYAAGVRNLLDWTYAHPVGEEILDVTLRQPGRTFVVDISAQF
jgi:outer membrane receptor for ferrienterochelin and colicins